MVDLSGKRQKTHCHLNKLLQFLKLIRIASYTFQWAICINAISRDMFFIHKEWCATQFNNSHFSIPKQTVFLKSK